MKYTLRAIACVCLFIAAMMTYDLTRAALLPGRARGVRVGDAKGRVRAILGRPDDTFGPDLHGGLFSHRQEHWVYGSAINTREPFLSEFPWFVPFRFRLFLWDPDDVVIEFDDHGLVSDVSIPDVAPEK